MGINDLRGRRPAQGDVADRSDPFDAPRRTSGLVVVSASLAIVGAVLADTHDEWATDERRYLSEESMAKIGATDEDEPVALTKG